MNHISILISLAGVWILYFFCYRSYRVDKLRQSLFALRDELFDLARAGDISFKDPAYKMLRNTINGQIQYGHRYTLADLVCFSWRMKSEIAENIRKEYSQKWSLAISKVDPEVQAKLLDIRHRSHLKILEQLIFTSAILTFTIVTVVVFMVLKYFGGRIGKCLRNTAYSIAEKTGISKLFSDIDANSHLRATF